MLRAEARLQYQFDECRIQWAAIQNQANLREARRLQRYGRYTKTERAELDRLMAEMESIKSRLALLRIPTDAAVQ
jgi:hypothetical protein